MPTVSDRRVPFDGATNFRDLGGYRTRTGATVRWGMVFRADSLHGLGPDDLVRYERLGLRAVYDLRGEVERQERPDPVESRHLPVSGRPADAPARTAAEGLTGDDGERILRDLYVGLIEHAALLIGNSSSGLYEAPSFKLPTVNIGDRQQGRPRAASVIDCPPQRRAITAAIARARHLDCSAAVNPFGDGNATERIMRVLREIGDPGRLLKKRFRDLGPP